MGKQFYICWEEAAHLFRYKRVRDEKGDLCKVLFPFDKRKDYLPCIEYTQEYENNRRIGRLWIPTFFTKSELVEQTKQSFDSIKQWINRNCTRKEKMDGSIYVL